MKTFSYANAGEEIGYHFHTYHWDSAGKEFSEMQSAFYPSDSEFPKEWYDTEVYANFGQYEITEESIEQLKDGYLFIDDVKIGDNLADLENNDQLKTEEQYYQGGETYIVNSKFEVIRESQDGKVPKILYFTNLINQSYAEIEEV